VADDKMCPYTEIKHRFSGFSMRLMMARDPYDQRVRRTGKTRPRCEWRIPTVRKKCPVCGRRVKARLEFCSDGCCEIWLIPRHKKREFWKPKRGTRRNKGAQRQKHRHNRIS